MDDIDTESEPVRTAARLRLDSPRASVGEGEDAARIGEGSDEPEHVPDVDIAPYQLPFDAFNLPGLYGVLLERDLALDEPASDNNSSAPACSSPPLPSGDGDADDGGNRLPSLTAVPKARRLRAFLLALERTYRPLDTGSKAAVDESGAEVECKASLGPPTLEPDTWFSTAPTGPPAVLSMCLGDPEDPYRDPYQLLLRARQGDRAGRGGSAAGADAKTEQQQQQQGQQGQQQPLPPLSFPPSWVPYLGRSLLFMDLFKSPRLDPAAWDVGLLGSLPRLVYLGLRSCVLVSALPAHLPAHLPSLRVLDLGRTMFHLPAYDVTQMLQELLEAGAPPNYTPAVADSPDGGGKQQQAPAQLVIATSFESVVQAQLSAQAQVPRHRGFAPKRPPMPARAPSYASLSLASNVRLDVFYDREAGRSADPHGNVWDEGDAEVDSDEAREELERVRTRRVTRKVGNPQHELPLRAWRPKEDRHEAVPFGPNEVDGDGARGGGGDGGAAAGADADAGAGAGAKEQDRSVEGRGLKGFDGRWRYMRAAAVIKAVREARERAFMAYARQVWWTLLQPAEGGEAAQFQMKAEFRSSTTPVVAQPLDFSMLRLMADLDLLRIPSPALEEREEAAGGAARRRDSSDSESAGERRGGRQGARPGGGEEEDKYGDLHLIRLGDSKPAAATSRSCPPLGDIRLSLSWPFTAPRVDTPTWSHEQGLHSFFLNKDRDRAAYTVALTARQWGLLLEGGPGQGPGPGLADWRALSTDPTSPEAGGDPFEAEEVSLQALELRERMTLGALFAAGTGCGQGLLSGGDRHAGALEVGPQRITSENAEKLLRGRPPAGARVRLPTPAALAARTRARRLLVAGLLGREVAAVSPAAPGSVSLGLLHMALRLEGRLYGRVRRVSILASDHPAYAATHATRYWASVRAVYDVLYADPRVRAAVVTGAMPLSAAAELPAGELRTLVARMERVGGMGVPKDGSGAAGGAGGQQLPHPQPPIAGGIATAEDVAAAALAAADAADIEALQQQIELGGRLDRPLPVHPADWAPAELRVDPLCDWHIAHPSAWPHGTVLHGAVARGHLRTVTWLLDRGLPLNGRISVWDFTPLHLCCMAPMKWELEPQKGTKQHVLSLMRVPKKEEQPHKRPSAAGAAPLGGDSGGGDGGSSGGQEAMNDMTKTKSGQGDTESDSESDDSTDFNDRDFLTVQRGLARDLDRRLGLPTLHAFLRGSDFAFPGCCARRVFTLGSGGMLSPLWYSADDEFEPGLRNFIWNKYRTQQPFARQLPAATPLALPATSSASAGTAVAGGVGAVPGAAVVAAVGADLVQASDTAAVAATAAELTAAAPAMLRLLLERGPPDLGARSWCGLQPAHYAAATCGVETLATLAEAGASLRTPVPGSFVGPLHIFACRAARRWSNLGARTAARLLGCAALVPPADVLALDDEWRASPLTWLVRGSRRGGGSLGVGTLGGLLGRLRAGLGLDSKQAGTAAAPPAEVLFGVARCLAVSISTSRLDHVRVLLEHFPEAVSVALPPLGATLLHLACMLPVVGELAGRSPALGMFAEFTAIKNNVPKFIIEQLPPCLPTWMHWTPATWGISIPGAVSSNAAGTTTDADVLLLGSDSPPPPPPLSQSPSQSPGPKTIATGSCGSGQGGTGTEAVAEPWALWPYVLAAYGPSFDPGKGETATTVIQQCLEDQLQLVQLLLAAGAPVDAPDTAGVTPLMVAALTGSPPVVGAILAKGASLTQECALLQIERENFFWKRMSGCASQSNPLGLDYLLLLPPHQQPMQEPPQPAPAPAAAPAPAPALPAAAGAEGVVGVGSGSAAKATEDDGFVWCPGDEIMYSEDKEWELKERKKVKALQSPARVRKTPVENDVDESDNGGIGGNGAENAGPEAKAGKEDDELPDLAPAERRIKRAMFLAPSLAKRFVLTPLTAAVLRAMQHMQVTRRPPDGEPPPQGKAMGPAVDGRPARFRLEDDGRSRIGAKYNRLGDGIMWLILHHGPPELRSRVVAVLRHAEASSLITMMPRTAIFVVAATLPGNRYLAYAERAAREASAVLSVFTTTSLDMAIQKALSLTIAEAAPGGAIARTGERSRSRRGSGAGAGALVSSGGPGGKAAGCRWGPYEDEVLTDVLMTGLYPLFMSPLATNGSASILRMSAQLLQFADCMPLGRAVLLREHAAQFPPRLAASATATATAAVTVTSSCGGTTTSAASDANGAVVVAKGAPANESAPQAPQPLPHVGEDWSMENIEPLLLASFEAAASKSQQRVFLAGPPGGRGAGDAGGAGAVVRARSGTQQQQQRGAGAGGGGGGGAAPAAGAAGAGSGAGVAGSGGGGAGGSLSKVLILHTQDDMEYGMTYARTAELMPPVASLRVALEHRAALPDVAMRTIGETMFKFVRTLCHVSQDELEWVRLPGGVRMTAVDGLFAPITPQDPGWNVSDMFRPQNFGFRVIFSYSKKAVCLELLAVSLLRTVPVDIHESRGAGAGGDGCKAPALSSDATVAAATAAGQGRGRVGSAPLRHGQADEFHYWTRNPDAVRMDQVEKMAGRLEEAAKMVGGNWRQMPPPPPWWISGWLDRFLRLFLVDALREKNAASKHLKLRTLHDRTILPQGPWAAPDGSPAHPWGPVAPWSALETQVLSEVMALMPLEVTRDTDTDLHHEERGPVDMAGRPLSQKFIQAVNEIVDSPIGQCMSLMTKAKQTDHSCVVFTAQWNRLAAERKWPLRSTFEIRDAVARLLRMSCCEYTSTWEKSMQQLMELLMAGDTSPGLRRETEAKLLSLASDAAFARRLVWGTCRGRRSEARTLALLSGVVEFQPLLLEALMEHEAKLEALAQWQEQEQCWAVASGPALATMEPSRLAALMQEQHGLDEPPLVMPYSEVAAPPPGAAVAASTAAAAAPIQVGRASAGSGTAKESADGSAPGADSAAARRLMYCRFSSRQDLVVALASPLVVYDNEVGGVEGFATGEGAPDGANPGSRTGQQQLLLGSRSGRGGRSASRLGAGSVIALLPVSQWEAAAVPHGRVPRRQEASALSFFSLVFSRLPRGLRRANPRAAGTMWGQGLQAVTLHRRPAPTRWAPWPNAGDVAEEGGVVGTLFDAHAAEPLPRTWLRELDANDNGVVVYREFLLAYQRHRAGDFLGPSTQPEDPSAFLSRVASAAATAQLDSEPAGGAGSQPSADGATADPVVPGSSQQSEEGAAAAGAEDAAAARPLMPAGGKVAWAAGPAADAAAADGAAGLGQAQGRVGSTASRAWQRAGRTVAVGQMSQAFWDRANAMRKLRNGKAADDQKARWMAAERDARQSGVPLTAEGVSGAAAARGRKQAGMAAVRQFGARALEALGAGGPSGPGGGDLPVVLLAGLDCAVAEEVCEVQRAAWVAYANMRSAARYLTQAQSEGLVAAAPGGAAPPPSSLSAGLAAALLTAANTPSRPLLDAWRAAEQAALESVMRGLGAAEKLFAAAGPGAAEGAKGGTGAGTDAAGGGGGGSGPRSWVQALAGTAPLRTRGRASGANVSAHPRDIFLLEMLLELSAACTGAAAHRDLLTEGELPPVAPNPGPSMLLQPRTLATAATMVGADAALELASAMGGLALSTCAQAAERDGMTPPLGGLDELFAASALRLAAEEIWGFVTDMQALSDKVISPLVAAADQSLPIIQRESIKTIFGDTAIELILEYETELLKLLTVQWRMGARTALVAPSVCGPAHHLITSTQRKVAAARLRAYGGEYAPSAEQLGLDPLSKGVQLRPLLSDPAYLEDVVELLQRLATAYTNYLDCIDASLKELLAVLERDEKGTLQALLRRFARARKVKSAPGAATGSKKDAAAADVMADGPDGADAVGAKGKDPNNNKDEEDSDKEDEEDEEEGKDAPAAVATVGKDDKEKAPVKNEGGRGEGKGGGVRLEPPPHHVRPLVSIRQLALYGVAAELEACLRKPAAHLATLAFLSTLCRSILAARDQLPEVEANAIASAAPTYGRGEAKDGSDSDSSSSSRSSASVGKQTGRTTATATNTATTKKEGKKAVTIADPDDDVDDSATATAAEGPPAAEAKGGQAQSALAAAPATAAAVVVASQGSRSSRRGGQAGEGVLGARSTSGRSSAAAAAGGGGGEEGFLGLLRRAWARLGGVQVARVLPLGSVHPLYEFAGLSGARPGAPAVSRAAMSDHRVLMRGVGAAVLASEKEVAAAGSDRWGSARAVRLLGSQPTLAERLDVWMAERLVGGDFSSRVLLAVCTGLTCLTWRAVPLMAERKRYEEDMRIADNLLHHRRVVRELERAINVRPADDASLDAELDELHAAIKRAHEDATREMDLGEGDNSKASPMSLDSDFWAKEGPKRVRNLEPLRAAIKLAEQHTLYSTFAGARLLSNARRCAIRMAAVSSGSGGADGGGGVDDSDEDMILDALTAPQAKKGGKKADAKDKAMEKAKGKGGRRGRGSKKKGGALAVVPAPSGKGAAAGGDGGGPAGATQLVKLFGGRGRGRGEEGGGPKPAWGDSGGGGGPGGGGLMAGGMLAAVRAAQNAAKFGKVLRRAVKRREHARRRWDKTLFLIMESGELDESFLVREHAAAVSRLRRGAALCAWQQLRGVGEDLLMVFGAVAFRDVGRLFALVMALYLMIFPFVIMSVALAVSPSTAHERLVMSGLVGAYVLAGFGAMAAAVWQLRHDPSQLKVYRPSDHIRFPNFRKGTALASWKAHWVNVFALVTLVLEFWQLCAFSYQRRIPYPEASFLKRIFPWALLDLGPAAYFLQVFALLALMVVWIAVFFPQTPAGLKRIIMPFLGQAAYLTITSGLLSQLDCRRSDGLLVRNPDITCWVEPQHLYGAIAAMLALGLYVPRATLTPFEVFFPSQNLDIKYRGLYVRVVQLLRLGMAGYNLFFADTYPLTVMCANAGVCALLAAMTAVMRPCCISLVNIGRGAGFVAATWSQVVSVAALRLSPNVFRDPNNGQFYTNSWIYVYVLVAGWGAIAAGAYLLLRRDIRRRNSTTIKFSLKRSPFNYTLMMLPPGANPAAGGQGQVFGAAPPPPPPPPPDGGAGAGAGPLHGSTTGDLLGYGQGGFGEYGYGQKGPKESEDGEEEPTAGGGRGDAYRAELSEALGLPLLSADLARQLASEGLLTPADEMRAYISKLVRVAERRLDPQGGGDSDDDDNSSNASGGGGGGGSSRDGGSSD